MLIISHKYVNIPSRIHSTHLLV